MKETIIMPTLKGIYNEEYFKSGQIKACMVQEMNTITTPYGDLVPLYNYEDDRRKYLPAIEFHKNGQIKSIHLHSQSVIKTSIGAIPAELITFYEDGSLRRIFPVNGKVTGYWGEENEIELVDATSLDFNFCNFNNRFMSFLFYPKGQLKAVTLWSDDELQITTSVGEIIGRIGFNVYPNGSLKSLEPKFPTLIETPIGKIVAYDPTALGIHSDTNSLNFYKDGSLESLKTTENVIKIYRNCTLIDSIKPLLVPSQIDIDEMDLMPMTIEFTPDFVTINGDKNATYKLSEVEIEINTFETHVTGGCSACSSCSGCI